VIILQKQLLLSIDKKELSDFKTLKNKNKPGYKKRQGHRQPLTVLKVTGIK